MSGSGSGNSWFGMAPRPSTPTRSYSNTSAPNSPLCLPRIERVPSQDALERSSHNNSGHGKSTLQIIRELKASNAKLSAKTADMEADFMNQLNLMTMKFNDKEDVLKKSLDGKEQQFTTMESRVLSTENRIRERDTQLSTLKEETTFQRHTIADVKNQLYQLQHEIEDAEYDKRDEVDKWSLEKKEMERELESLRESQSDENEGVMQSWKQLDATKAELDSTQECLRETQISLTNVENESKRTEKEHYVVETELRCKIEGLEKQDVAAGDLNKELVERGQTVSALKEEIGKYTTQVAEMTVEITELKAHSQSEDKYRRDEAEDLRVLNESLQASIERLKNELEDTDKDLDEREELLHARNEQIGDLRSELERVSTELIDSKEQGAASSEEQAVKLAKQIDDLRSELERVSTELIDFKEQAAASSEEQAGKLAKQLEESREECELLQVELKSMSQKYSEHIDTLQKEVHTLIADRDDIESKLESAEETRDKARHDLEQGKNLRNQDESRTAQRLREIVSNAAKERSELETEFEARLANVEQAYQKKMTQLAANNIDPEELQALKNESKQKVLEIERLSSQLREAEVLLSSSRSSSDEARTLRERVRILEAKKVSVDRAKKQLREAQIALVALDDEKTLSDKKHQDKIAALESQKSELDRGFRAQVLQKDAEMTRLREHSSTSRVSDYVVEIEKLSSELKDKDAMLEFSKSKSALNASSANVDDALRRELLVSKRAEEKLQASLYSARQEQAVQHTTLREKLEDRDTTISALVKSSVSQEQKLASMKEEVAGLKRQIERNIPSSFNHEMAAVKRAREADFVDDVENLRNALEDSKDNEKRLFHDLSTLERKLVEIETENKRLKMQVTSASSHRGNAMFSDHQEKLQERDAAIATLVKQSMSLEEQVTALKTESVSLRVEKGGLSSGIKNHTGPSWGEVRRLQKESEIFAGQIIEQDEELEALRSTVEERDARFASLEREMLGLKRKASSHNRSEDRVEDLQAELDELQESNKSQRSEIRDMRKQLRETKESANQIMDLRAELEQAHYALTGLKNKAGSTARDDVNLRRELETVQREKEAVEMKLSQQIESMRRLRNLAIEEMEKKLKERDAKIEELKRDDRVIMLEGEIKNLSKNLFEKAEILEDAQISIKDLKQMLNDQSKTDDLANQKQENEKLSQQVTEMRRELNEFSSDKMNIDAIKQQLQTANQDKQELEQRIEDSYERKMSLLKLDKDVTIDSLRKELIESKAVNSEYNEDVVKHIESLEMENADVKDELEAKLQLKNTKIHALEQTLGAQEQLVENMRAEMDQLQSSMERTSLSRRAEIEEMQQEMIDTSSKAQRQDREITSLKMSLEDCRLEYKADVTKLKRQIQAMEESPRVPEQTAPKRVDARLDDVKERLENLKWRNTSLQEENLKLRTRLERVEGEVSTTRSDQDKAASAMEQEVALLRKRVRELEEKPALSAKKPASTRSQMPKMPSNDRGTSRFGRTSRMSSPARNKNKVQAESPRRSQASPLRFLKRRSSQKELTGDSGKSVGDSSSAASKMTF